MQQGHSQEVLFIVKFELGEKLSDQIEFRKGDIAEELALEFCERNELGASVYTTIVSALEEKYQTVQKLNGMDQKNNR